MENILFKIKLFDGRELAVNVDNAKDLFDAAPEIKESIEAGDITIGGIPIKVEDVRWIEDIKD